MPRSKGMFYLESDYYDEDKRTTLLPEGLRRRPKRLCQWPGCEFVGVAFMRRGMDAEMRAICSVHREQFYALSNHAVRDMAWQEARSVLEIAPQNLADL